MGCLVTADGWVFRDMELLKNRKFAILITVIIAVCATLFGVYRTAGRYTRKIETMFYDGVYLQDGGYTQPGIDSHLNNAANAALGLATVMGKYPELEYQTGQLISARRELLAAKSINDKSSANLEMWARFINLSDAVTASSPDIALTDSDKTAEAQYLETFRGASNAMSDSLYNTEVTKYLDGRS